MHCMTSQLNVDLIRRVRGPLVSLTYFLTCYTWLFVQPGTARRPVDWCSNKKSVRYELSVLVANHNNFKLLLYYIFIVHVEVILLLYSIFITHVVYCIIHFPFRGPCIYVYHQYVLFVHQKMSVFAMILYLAVQSINIQYNTIVLYCYCTL